MATIDKKLYRQAMEYYREWNEAELKDRVRNAGKLSPAEAWRQYVDLWEFCIELNPDGGKGQRQQKLRNIADYYAQIERFEQWRLRRGKSS